MLWKFGIWIAVFFCLTLVAVLLFIPFPSFENTMETKKLIGAQLLKRNLISIQSVDIKPFEGGGYWPDEVVSGYENIIQFPVSIKVQNNSEKVISLIRGRLKMPFKNFKIQNQTEQPVKYEIGQEILPNSSKICRTWIQFKYHPEELETIKTEINEREMSSDEITEVWAAVPDFNPFAEIISYFQK